MLQLLKDTADTTLLSLETEIYQPDDAGSVILDTVPRDYAHTDEVKSRCETTVLSK